MYIIVFVTHVCCVQDTFRIENENDAQIVLKVTQKLTDVLMDYRLRTVSTVCNFSNESTSAPDIP